MDKTEREIQMGRALLIFTMAAVIIIGTGVLIGELFFWNKYDSVNPIDKDISYLNTIADRNKNDDKVLVELGWLYYRQGDYQKAISTLTRAVKINRLNPTAHYNLGLAYQEIKLHGKAEAEFIKTAELDQDSKVAYYSLGRLYFTQRNWDKAIDQFKVAVKKDPISADNYLWLGKAYEKKGLNAEAKAAYQEVLARLPNNSEAKEAYYRLK